MNGELTAARLPEKPGPAAPTMFCSSRLITRSLPAL